MKTIYLKHLIILLLTLLLLNGNVRASSPERLVSMIEHVVPLYIGSKTASGTNNARTPFAVCLEITGLTPVTKYDVQIGIGLITDGATVFGAGNVWNTNRNSFSGQLDTLAFETDISGNSGPFWAFIQPTGNGSRFDAGQIHNLRVGYAVTGGSISGTPAFIGTKQITALDIAVTSRTPSTADDGAFIRGIQFPFESGKLVLLYNNTGGTGNPLFSYQIRNATAVNPLQSELPAVISQIYNQSGTSVVGDFACVVPIGANNPDGVRRIEIRNSDNTIYLALQDIDGIWPNGANTANIVRREVMTLNNFHSLSFRNIIQGFYNSQTNSMVPDTAKIILRSNLPPYNIVDSSVGVLNQNGDAIFNFNNVLNNTLYYLDFRHRNSIETWSALGQSFSFNNMSYDFSGSASQAFGSNLIGVNNSPVLFATYNGDVNQDGIIELTDVVEVYNNASTFVTGYVPQDVNYDDIVDLTDIVKTFNNSVLFITRIIP